MLSMLPYDRRYLYHEPVDILLRVVHMRAYPNGAPARGDVDPVIPLECIDNLLCRWHATTNTAAWHGWAETNDMGDVSRRWNCKPNRLGLLNYPVGQATECRLNAWRPPSQHLLHTGNQRRKEHDIWAATHIEAGRTGGESGREAQLCDETIIVPF